MLGHGGGTDGPRILDGTIRRSKALCRLARRHLRRLCPRRREGDDPERYRGFIREAKFGDVVLTDILLSEQRIRRNNRHISMLDKDCYYIQLLQSGNISVIQRDDTLASNAARGAIFSATEEYELHGHGEVRSFYLELPRDEFARRFPRERIPVTASINTAQGLGRIATEFCAALAAESLKLDEGVRTPLGGQLMDLLAFALLTSEGDMPAAEGAVKKARLRSVQQWIEAHFADAELSLERIAAANGMSLRYLHVLFETSEMSVSEWIWRSPPADRLRRPRQSRRPFDHIDRLRLRLQQLGAFQQDVPPQVRGFTERRGAEHSISLRRALKSRDQPSPPYDRRPRFDEGYSGGGRATEIQHSLAGLRAISTLFAGAAS